MNHVLLIKGESQYSAMRNYIDEIEVGFRLAGYHTYVLDATEKSCMFQLEELLNSCKIDLTFVCNAILQKSIPGAYYLTYLTDHPAAHRERLSELDEKSCIFVCDRRYEAYIRQYCPNIKHVRYVPLSGEAASKYIPFHCRSRDLVFTGSYNKPEEMYQQLSYDSKDMQKVAKYVAADLIENPEKDLETGLKDGLSLLGNKVSDQEFHELMWEFMAIDAYARSYYRDKVIRTLLENGLQVHVFGNGWENFEGKGKENLVIEKGDYYVARKAVADAKISLNVMPWFKDGFQERIAAAMLSGTIAVTDESAYICENFTDGKELILYSLHHLDELPAKIKELLEHPEKAERIAEAGKTRAKKEMTWQHRTFEMIRYAQECFSLPVPQKGIYGEILQISYRTLHERRMLPDAIRNMNEIIDLISQVRLYDKADLSDVDYFYKKFLMEFVKINANFPEINFSEFTQRYLSGLQAEQADDGAELLILECMHLLAVFQSMENQYLEKEKEEKEQKLAALQLQLSEIDTRPNRYTWQMLIEKLKFNYQETNDADIQEILKNIEVKRYVPAYSQRFAEKYESGMIGLRELICYDKEAQMIYAIWNGKRMYYPKGSSVEFVVSAFNFVCMEQDPKSPHRYLDETFDVQQGDIVVDAGVAEGNFALDVVELAKKVYLVECESMWIEALQKTFEPWKEKVVIVEKMLGETNDEHCVTLDSLVEEDHVNFLKLDVEGAEIPSLRGASRILKDSKNIKCAICAYHRKNAEQEIRKLLEEHHFYTSTTRGYMFFKEDMDSWLDGELRHGIVRAVKS